MNAPPQPLAAGRAASPTRTWPKAQPAAQPAQALPPVQSLPPVQALPPVQPLPPVQALPPVQSLPPVQPLPPAQQAAYAGGYAQPGPTPASPSDKWKWLRLVLVAIIALGGVAKVAKIFDRKGGASPPTTRTATPDAPSPRTAPQSAPEPAPQPAPDQQAGPLTPDGLPVVTLANDGPTFQSSRIDGDQGSLLVQFGVMVGDQPVTYAVALSFPANQQTGAGKVMAFRGKQRATTEVIGADQYELNGLRVLRVFGAMKRNDFGAPALCVVIGVAHRYDSVQLAPNSAMSVYGLDANNECDGKQEYGNGVIR